MVTLMTFNSQKKEEDNNNNSNNKNERKKKLDGSPKMLLPLNCL